jgi:ribosomal protein S18 acetylase RimI-like enzyme
MTAPSDALPQPLSGDDLLSRIEDAGLNASAPPQQRWLDGWLVRLSPGKARRARCVNALAQGRLPLADKLALAGAAFAEAGLPLLVRITGFTQPAGLDDELAAMGYTVLDPTRVMVKPTLPAQTLPPLPPGLALEPLAAEAFARTVGALRSSPPGECAAHAHRLIHSPVHYRGHVLRDTATAEVLACGQFAREGAFVGLYDVFTAPQARGRGMATVLCERMLSAASSEGGTVAYLQVAGDNAAALRIYQRLGFVDGYGYHYRQPSRQALG